MICHRIGCSPIGTMGLGRTSVTSRRRVPLPPQRIITGISGKDKSRFPGEVLPVLEVPDAVLRFRFVLDVSGIPVSAPLLVDSPFLSYPYSTPYPAFFKLRIGKICCRSSEASLRFGRAARCPFCRKCCHSFRFSAKKQLTFPGFDVIIRPVQERTPHCPPSRTVGAGT